MGAFWKTLAHTLEGGTPAVLVSVLESSGSTPRGAGALMAVFARGRPAGTIGGGNVEHEAQSLAAELLDGGADTLRTFRFRPGEAASLGMVCGGDVTVHFQRLCGGDLRSAELFRALSEAESRGRDTWLVRRLEDAAVAETGLADREGVRGLESPLPEGLLDSRPVWRDGWVSLPVVRGGRTYLFGGGHVSQALVPVLASVGFRPVVYDDRPEFSDPALFPGAAEVLCAPFGEIARHVAVTPSDDVVVVTRGHEADTQVLEQVLRSGARYIGCIGSRRKLAACRERLLAEGFTAEEYDRLHAPIGLAIGAETPEEIAVAVAAEMIAVRAGVLR